MNAIMFNAFIAMVVLVLGFFALLVGGKSSQARNLKESGDDQGFASALFDLYKMTAGSVLVLGIAVVSFAGTFVLAPELLMVPLAWIGGDAVLFISNVILAMIAASVIGFYAGVYLQERAVGVRAPVGARKVSPALTIASIVGFFGVFASKVSATAMNETLAPVTEILNWAGGDMMPAVLILILAVIPLIMVMIGVRFAGGLLNQLLDGIRQIFSFKF